MGREVKAPGMPQKNKDPVVWQKFEKKHILLILIMIHGDSRKSTNRVWRVYRKS